MHGDEAFASAREPRSGGFFDDELAVGKREQGAAAVDHCFHDHVMAPELLDILESFLGIFELQVAAVVVVLE